MWNFNCSQLTHSLHTRRSIHMQSYFRFIENNLRFAVQQAICVWKNKLMKLKWFQFFAAKRKMRIFHEKKIVGLKYNHWRHLLHWCQQRNSPEVGCMWCAVHELNENWICSDINVRHFYDTEMAIERVHASTIRPTWEGNVELKCIFLFLLFFVSQWIRRKNFWKSSDASHGMMFLGTWCWDKKMKSYVSLICRRILRRLQNDVQWDTFWRRIV